jgi:NAD-dependent SIR2 family protein deacetylase
MVGGVSSSQTGTLSLYYFFIHILLIHLGHLHAGSFATSRCIECRSKMSGDQFVLQLDQIHPPDPLIVKCPQRSCLGKRTAC